ncbi:metallophosphoesterase family protein [Parabacteroides bouchesdurhonensis]|uniref:metallophosphoesterase family protein n=1 Tax=Parabacteroides bouchesdurhonensis TaxID=1936995 RepID=UPI000C81DC46
MDLRKVMLLGACCLASAICSLGFAQKPELKFNKDKKFKIVQFTDLHVVWQDKRSDVAFERMNQVLDEEKPDLVIFTGDIIYSKPADRNLRNVLKTVSDRKIPFAFTFGNHDHEQGMTNDELFAAVADMPYNITVDEVPELSGTGNCALPVKASNSNKTAAVLYCIDSHAYSQLKDVEGYDYIKYDQINWYLDRSAGFTKENGGEPLPALAFFHIALPEYAQAASDMSACLYGIRKEVVCCSPLNSGLFTAMKQSKDVMGIFVGHDHDDDYAVYWKGILLAYGRFTGGNTEYNHVPNGARVIEMKEGERSFRSWIRTKAGVEQETTFPDDFVRK